MIHCFNNINMILFWLFFLPVTVYMCVGTHRIPQNARHIIQNLDLSNELTVAFIIENAQNPLIVGL